jgi:hypothetical protein
MSDIFNADGRVIKGAGATAAKYDLKYGDESARCQGQHPKA